MKILFVGRKFGGVAGGVERTAITLMNVLSSKAHQISLLTWDDETAQTHYPLDPVIKWNKLSMGDPCKRAGWRLRLQRQLRIRAIVREVDPDAIIGYQQGAFLAVRLAVAGLGIPVVAAERNAPQRFNYLRAGKRRGLIFLTLFLAAKITVQFEEYRARYPWYLRKKIVYIPNPISPATNLANPAGTPGQPKILLFVGHLSYQKNPQVLVQAFMILAPEFPDWELYLVGDGEFKDELARLISGSPSKKIQMLGVFRDVEKFYQQAHLFCLPSLWEGFPNALGEALAHGLPGVGFEECAGTNLLIKPGINGLLAAGNNNAETLAKALGELMRSPERRSQVGREAIKSVAQFKSDVIFRQWESLFAEITRTK